MMIAAQQKEPQQRQAGAVQKARQIFDLAKDLPRKDAINLAVNLGGLKRGTASTQYQHWKKAHSK